MTEKQDVTRRNLVRLGGGAAIAAAATPLIGVGAASAKSKSAVSTVSTVDDLAGISHSEAGVVAVADPRRGGIFVPSDSTPNSGTVFVADGTDAWARQDANTYQAAWFAIDETGATNASADINAMIQDAQANGIERIVFSRSATYLLEDTIDLTGVHYLELDFNGAVIRDNVQGRIPESANRGKHTFLIYDASNITVRNINYECEATRDHHPDASIPTTLFWVGTNYHENQKTTKSITIEDVNIQNEIPNGLVVGILGETWDCIVRRVEVRGEWIFGIDIEYGLAPTAGDLFGKHPHNVLVENFNGYDNPVCQGFLRVASCYNVKFLNCEGRNVKAFIYCYSGDRNISRFGENVTFENCNHFADSNFTSAVNYVVWIVVVNLDGSTGEPLPLFTNYDHHFTFTNCEFQNNSTTFSACVRMFGTKGHVRFAACTLSGSWYGVRTGGSGGQNYLSATAFTMEDCLFKNNHQDVWLDRIQGARIQSCHFRDTNPEGIGSGSDASGVKAAVAVTSAPRNLVTDSRFEGIKLEAPYIDVDPNSGDGQISGNTFLGNPGAAMNLSARTYGHANTSDGELTDSFGLIGQSETLVRSLAAANEVLDVDAHRTFVVPDGVSPTIKGLVGGEDGVTVTVKSISATNTGTFKNADASVPAPQRLKLTAGSDLTETGELWAVQFTRLSGQWYQL